MNNLDAIEKQYGTRPRIPIGHGELLGKHHWRGELDDGKKFVYCPVGFLLSWNEGDYAHRFCPWCKLLFDEITADLQNVQ